MLIAFVMFVRCTCSVGFQTETHRVTKPFYGFPVRIYMYNYCSVGFHSETLRFQICQQPGLMANVSKEWRNIWAPKIEQCGEKDASIQSLPPLLQMVD